MLESLRQKIRAYAHADEPSVVDELLGADQLGPADRKQVNDAAIGLVERCRSQSHKAGTLDAFLQEFGLSNKEGIALMCLAEALLRVPDEETADIDTSNNSWPKRKKLGEFDQFKNKVKGQ